MPQVHCYLPQKTVEQLEEIKKSSGHTSLSKTVRAMIELGIQDILNREKRSQEIDDAKKRQEQEEQQRHQQTMYLHKILTLNNDIFRCVYDESKLSIDQINAEEKIVAEAVQEEESILAESSESWVFPLL